MQVLTRIVWELISLFVDDGSLAVIVLIWIVICGVALPKLALAASWHGPTLFIGLALILVESGLRCARGRFTDG
jgi:hypothetical protein